jgi:hypothetical protein
MLLNPWYPQQSSGYSCTGVSATSSRRLRSTYSRWPTDCADPIRWSEDTTVALCRVTWRSSRLGLSQTRVLEAFQERTPVLDDLSLRMQPVQTFVSRLSQRQRLDWDYHVTCMAGWLLILTVSFWKLFYRGRPKMWLLVWRRICELSAVRGRCPPVVERDIQDCGLDAEDR